MRVLLRMFDTTAKAQDGSSIPRYAVEEYLASPDYKIIIDEKLALGGVTHKDRQVDPKYSNIIAVDDQILVSDNVTHYITEIYLKPGDPICYAVVEILDPKNYEGKRRENILNLMADLNSGIKLPCSVVIQALWSYQNVAEKIIRIKGVDFTLGPSFEGSGTEKVFSSVKPEVSIDETKVFSAPAGKSYDGCTLKTVTFSTVSCEVISDSNPTQITSISLDDVARRYGRLSKVYEKARTYSFLTENQLKDLVSEMHASNGDGAMVFTDDDKLNWMKSVIKNNAGKDNSLQKIDDIFTTDKDAIVAIFDSIPGAGGPSAEQLAAQRLNELIDREPTTQTFSTINAVRDRMYFNKYPRYSLINRLIKSYKSYYDQHQDLDEYDMNWLQVLFIQDIGILLRNVIPNIVKGSTLDNLYALIQFSPEVSKAGLELSNVYRQVILAEKVLGFVPEGKYKAWKNALVNFLNELSKYAFGKELIIPVTAMDTLVKI